MVALKTYKGDPDGIRPDMECSNCGTIHGMTKGTYFAMPSVLRGHKKSKKR